MTTFASLPDPAVQTAIQLIERSGVLERSGIITELNLARDNFEGTFERILATIAADNTLSSRVLHLANSAWFGGSVKVRTVDEAFGRLGWNDFYKASLAAAVRLSLTDGATDQHEAWWAHSETVAHLCEMVSQHLQPDLVESSFQVGLLHDGAIPLMLRHVVDYAYLAQDALGHAPWSIEMELECNQTDHATVASVLAEAWKFPAAHPPVLRRHHAQSLSGAGTPEARRLLSVLLLAKRIQSCKTHHVDQLFAEPAERALHDEMVLALGATSRQIHDAMAELLRLYHLRQQTP